MSHTANYYFGIRGVKRGKSTHTLYIYADKIEVADGNLLLFYTPSGSSELMLYRAFAAGAWGEVFSASCLNGNEVQEEHDYNDTTGRDACRE